MRLKFTLIDKVACLHSVISILAWITYASCTENINMRLTDVSCSRIQVHLVNEFFK